MGEEKGTGTDNRERRGENGKGERKKRKNFENQERGKRKTNLIKKLNSIRLEMGNKQRE